MSLLRVASPSGGDGNQKATHRGKWTDEKLVTAGGDTF